jgi:hypothetical protein
MPKLLVLQLDSEKLRADRLSMVPLAEQIRSHCGTESEVVEATTTHDLLDKLALLNQANRKFGVVVVIGHSNEQGIKVSNDLFVPWEGFAKFLEPFDPRRLMLIACHAGRWSAARILFRKLPKLRRIFACPVTASRDLAKMMLSFLPYVVAAKVPKDNHILAVQIAGMAITGGQLRHWQRDRDMNNPDGVILDLASLLGDPVVREIPRVLRSWFGGER